jgi:hypothetical protein
MKSYGRVYIIRQRFSGALKASMQSQTQLKNLAP